MNMKPKLIASNNGLDIRNLRKSLSQKTIVRDVSLKIERGQTIGLLGPNGCGKSTTIGMLLGLIKPLSIVNGTLEKSGKDLKI